MTIEHATSGDLKHIRALVERYTRDVPTDPWSETPDALAVAIEKIIDNPAYLVLVGRDRSGIMGFLLAELKNDPIARTFVAVVHAAWVDPAYRGRAFFPSGAQIRDKALHILTVWARSKGATHLACLAERGAAMERLLGWTYRGAYRGRDFLMCNIETNVPKVVTEDGRRPEPTL